MHSPERGVVGRVPRAVELAVGPHRGDQHPIEREQQPNDECGQRNVEENPTPPARPFDHRGLPVAAPVIAGRDPAISTPPWHEMPGSRPGMTIEPIIANASPRGGYRAAAR